MHECLRIHTPLTTITNKGLFMAIASLVDVSSLINHQVQLQEHIHEHLLKAGAIANVALSNDFLDYNLSTVHAYL